MTLNYIINSDREIPSSEAARLRNIVRTLGGRIAERKALGKPATRDQHSDMQRALANLEVAPDSGI
jgi:hypothetical protein